MKTATLMMKETGSRVNLTGCDTFILDIPRGVQAGALFLLICYFECGGMVGETEYWATARIFNPVTGETSKPMKWEEIKQAYKRVSGKDNRINLWRIMSQWLSPEAREEIVNSITADAISRVI